MTALRLRSFDAEDAARLITTDELEEIRRAARAEGEAAGHAAALAETAALHAAAARALADTLSDWSFGYHEARQHILSQLGPVMEALLSRLLPEAARLTLVAHVADRLMPPLITATEAPLRIAVHPADRGCLDGLQTPLPFLVMEDADLPRGAVRLPHAPETVIAPSRAAEEALAAIADFFALNTEVRLHA
ncbi:hypothetical protein [Falsirhodobacter algicola]|uniref:Flagellar biosynthesis protein n=1 Tax=Falsirhodobacter algicola TaxID=2692330 RepID=A0A8J8MT36_9RHOB|nr:hypothetical protein [Falsirhodobacter algicola]QUS35916.1 hypothetical protein GR316_06375 [Falsirhodobacter algicola]